MIKYSWWMLCNLSTNKNGSKYLLQLYCTQEFFFPGLAVFSFPCFNYLSSGQQLPTQLSLSLSLPTLLNHNRTSCTTIVNSIFDNGSGFLRRGHHTSIFQHQSRIHKEWMPDLVVKGNNSEWTDKWREIAWWSAAADAAAAGTHCLDCVWKSGRRKFGNRQKPGVWVFFVYYCQAPCTCLALESYHHCCTFPVTWRCRVH